MKRDLMIGICMVVGMALAAEARDWGFSKDTVYQWKPRGDSVWLMNSGVDTLRLDSMIAMDVDTSEWMYAQFVYRPYERNQHSVSLTQASFGNPVYVVRPGSKTLPAGKSALFHNFFIGPPPITSKRAYDLMSRPGDTIKMGVRLLAESGDEDTLIVVGIYAYRSSLNPRTPLRLYGSPILLDRDLRGRRVVPSNNFPALGR